MRALESQFGASLVLAAITVGVAVTLALIAAGRGAAAGRARWPPALRILAIGAAVVIVVSTALPQTWPPVLSGDGDLVLELGRGGLADWRSVIDAPGSFTAILLLANVALYVPLGFLGVLAWPQRAPLVLLAGVMLSLLVEISHFTISERVASTDDVLLNTGGLLIGWLAGVMVAGFAPLGPDGDPG